MVTCFSLLLLPFFPFKIDVIVEYLVIADSELQELSVVLRLCKKEHTVGDTFILYFVPDFVCFKNSGAHTFFFNSTWTIAIHLVTIFRRGRKLAKNVGSLENENLSFFTA